MRYIELKKDGVVYRKESDINRILIDQKFYWLIDSEVENSTLEIKNNTLIWKGGEYLSGNWHYGIFKNGSFYGTWENGIWENGNFNGKWISGIRCDESI